MLANFLRNKCQVQTKSTTGGALGNSVTWGSSVSYHCRRISVDVNTRNAYMQRNTVVTDRFLFRGNVALNLGQHRIIYGGSTYELVESAQHYENDTTVLVRKL